MTVRAVVWLMPLLLTLIAVLHLLPLVGVVSTEWLVRLYGITIDDPSLAVLMRHRAILFGLLGILILASVFRPHLRTAALLLSGLSMASFVLLAWPCESCTADIQSVLNADLAGLLVWALACVIQLSSNRSPNSD